MANTKSLYHFAVIMTVVVIAFVIEFLCGRSIVPALTQRNASLAAILTSKQQGREWGNKITAKSANQTRFPHAWIDKAARWRNTFGIASVQQQLQIFIQSLPCLTTAMGRGNWDDSSRSRTGHRTICELLKRQCIHKLHNHFTLLQKSEIFQVKKLYVNVLVQRRRSLITSFV